MNIIFLGYFVLTSIFIINNNNSTKNIIWSKYYDVLKHISISRIALTGVLFPRTRPFMGFSDSFSLLKLM